MSVPIELPTYKLTAGSVQYYGGCQESSAPAGTSYLPRALVAVAVTCGVFAAGVRVGQSSSATLVASATSRSATLRTLSTNVPMTAGTTKATRGVPAQQQPIVRAMNAVPNQVESSALSFVGVTASAVTTFAFLAALLARRMSSTPGARVQPSSMQWTAASAAGLSQDELKKLVGYKAVDDHVRSGMVVGLGTGSTAYFAVERVGQKLKSGELKDIICIPTSERTREQAESLGIPLCTLNEKSRLDVSIDGADEVDPDWNLVKGGGGALLREKMVEIVSDKFICIVDESKLCKGLGPGFPLPVEITPFCHEHTLRIVAELPAIKPYLKEAVLRMGSSSNNKRDGDNIAVTDNGNYIVDLHFKEILKDAPAAAAQLKNTVGVVDHGLFINMATEVIVAGKEGVYVLPKAK